MPSQGYVVDDWLIHDLLGDNGVEAQKEALNFLKTLKEKCDHIAVLEGTSWTDKAYHLMTFDDPLRRGLSKYLRSVIGILSNVVDRPSQAAILSGTSSASKADWSS